MAPRYSRAQPDSWAQPGSWAQPDSRAHPDSLAQPHSNGSKRVLILVATLVGYFGAVFSTLSLGLC